MKKRPSQSTRYSAVCEVLAGDGISEVARRHMVNRSSVYRWVKLSRKAIQRELGANRHKERADRQARRNLEKQLVGLQRRLEKKSALVRELRREAKRKTCPDPRPPNCPNCGCEKIYKNGLYYQPLNRVIPPDKYFSGKIPVKRFVCAACHYSINLELPEVLYHWFKLGGENGPPGEVVGKIQGYPENSPEHFLDSGRGGRG